MRILLLTALPAFSLGVATPATAQSIWRFGVTASAPTRVLEVNEVAFPDSNDGRVGLKLGLGAEASRAWQIQPEVAAFAFLRATTAQTETSLGGSTWSAGRAFLIDVGGRVERTVSPGASVFGGAGVSHWEGPDDTAPFAGLGAMLLMTEAGLTLHPGNRRVRIDFTASLTRIGADETNDIGAGFVWRFFVGVRRGR